MASVRSGRCGHHRFLSGSGTGPEMGVAAILRLGLGDIQAVLAAQDRPFSASGQRWGRTTGVLAHVANGRAVKISSRSKYPVGTYRLSGETVALSSGARTGSKWSAGILGLFDPDRKKQWLGPAGTREAGLWQEIGLGQSVAEFAGEHSALEVA